MDANQEPAAVAVPNLDKLALSCPVCKTVELQLRLLEPDLPAYQCDTCGGMMIISTHYWNWLEQQAQETPTPSSPSSADEPPVTDSEHAKKCPLDGHILIRYDIAIDITFSIEQCGQCNSFWLDKHEWDVLKSRSLHTRLHKVSTPTWQRRLREKRSQQFWQATYQREFGDDYAEIRRVRAWLRQHPKHEQLLAYLTKEDPYSA
jgi:Zn-finger nucleic acid-binding protein